MQINFSKQSLFAITENNNSKPSFGKSTYFSEPKIVEQSGFYYIKLPSGQLSPLGKSIPREKPLGAKLNEVLRSSQTPDKLRKFYDKIYAAAVKGHETHKNITEEGPIAKVVNGIKDSILLNDVKKMFEITIKGNDSNTYTNGSMAGSLCSENSRLGAIVNVFKKLAK